MGLQAWYPLINDMRNQGVGDTDLVVETTPTFGAGKIGNALISGGNSHWTAAQSEKVLNNNAISICFWVYIDAPEGDTNKRAMFFGNDQKRIYSLFNYPTCNDFHWSWYSYDASGEGEHKMGGVLKGVLPSYHWTHVAITYSNPNGVIYINGEKEKTFSGVMNNYTFSDQTPVIYQCAYRKLNDFRVYDHALSPREVKEISKGLVLHYPLSMPGQENLTPCGGTYTQSNPITTTSSKTDGGVWIPNSAFEGTPSTTYTISVQCDGTLSNAHSTGGLSPADKPWSFWLYISNTDTSKSWQTGGYDKPINLNSSNHNYRKIGNTHVWTYTLSSTQKYISLRTNSYSDGTTNVTVNWWNIKVEKGDTFTPWIPSTSSELYTALGFNDSIEYDVSGYEHNGTKVGSITYDADTPRYETGAVFDGTTYVINNTSTVHLSNEFTISWWGKINTWRQVWEGMFLLQNTTALNSASGTYSIANSIRASKDNMMTLTFRQGGTSYPFDHYEWTYTIGTWAHYAFTYKDGVVIMYQNGVQVYTATIDNSSSGDYYYTIGRRVNNCICQLSDFRIYNTALSADDILELYHTSETLSNNGTLLTQGEFEES